MPCSDELQRRMTAGEMTAEALTRRYLARIRTINPDIRAVTQINPHAIEEAQGSDARRAGGHGLGPLEGIPVLVKDNIDVVGGMPTTAGSLALLANVPARDAAVVSRIRAAGMVLLGKTNLSEWANIRSTHSISGWSATGGLTRNPYALDRSACGSSSGSAAAVSVDLAPMAVGTETDGSITCPSSVNGLVGLKPTVGLVSRSGIVPISRSQDTPGPMTRCVTDAALLLDAMAGADAADAATAAAPRERGSYARRLQAGALRGARIGVVRFLHGYSPKTLAVFDSALRTLREQGTVLIDIRDFDLADMGDQELDILLTEFKSGVDAYLAATPPAVVVRSLSQLIDFNRFEARELALFDQDLFERAIATQGVDDPRYLATLHAAQQRAGPNGIDKLLRDNDVIALIAPTGGPAWTIDEINGDPGGGGSAGRLAAVSGYPHLTVPMGNVAGMPVGLSFTGAAWSEGTLLSLGYAFEQASHARKPPPTTRRGR